MTELKPCPFCGGKAIDTISGIRCTKCGGAMMADVIDYADEEIIEAWNMRDERTCEIVYVKKGPMYDVWRYTCCGYEHAESVSEYSIPQNFCPNCGAKVVK